MKIRSREDKSCNLRLHQIVSMFPTLAANRGMAVCRDDEGIFLALDVVNRHHLQGVHSKIERDPGRIWFYARKMEVGNSCLENIRQELRNGDLSSSGAASWVLDELLADKVGWLND